MNANGSETSCIVFLRIFTKRLTVTSYFTREKIFFLYTNSIRKRRVLILTSTICNQINNIYV